jgi:hypothetical protein
MNTENTLISSAISIGVYVLYKVAKKYYVRSGCHDSTLEITVVDRATDEKVSIEQVKQEMEHKIDIELHKIAESASSLPK